MILREILFRFSKSFFNFGIYFSNFRRLWLVKNLTLHRLFWIFVILVFLRVTLGSLKTDPWGTHIPSTFSCISTPCDCCFSCELACEPFRRLPFRLPNLGNKIYETCQRIFCHNAILDSFLPSKQKFLEEKNLNPEDTIANDLCNSISTWRGIVSFYGVHIFPVTSLWKPCGVFYILKIQ